MTEQERLIIGRLIDKSKSAFIFALEIINKPSMQYRSENFTFNICNAWELLMKAVIVRDKGEDAIYFKDNKGRTISFKDCLKLVFTDYNNPIAKNLEVVSRLRNKSTHFITPDYDDLYVQVFQACVLHYVNYLKDQFIIDINNELPSNFLTIASNSKSLENIRATSELDKATFDQFLKEKSALKHDFTFEGVAVSFEVNMKSVKKGEDFTFRIDKNADQSVNIIRQISDPNNTHPFRQNSVIEYVNKALGYKAINQYSFKAIKSFEKFEESKELFYQHEQPITKCYSQKVPELIIRNIKEQPNYLEVVLKEYKEKRKK